MGQNRLKLWVQVVERDVFALYLAMGEPRVPWPAKAVATVVACYSISPIDLIPDVIPILGILDDLILLPLGIMLVVHLIPNSVMDDLRNKAAVRFVGAGSKLMSVTAAIFVFGIWVSVARGTAIPVTRYIMAK